MLELRRVLLLSLLTAACDDAPAAAPAPAPRAEPGPGKPEPVAKAPVAANPADDAASGAAADVRADYENVCHAAVRSGAAGEADPSVKATKMAKWLTGQLRTEQVKQVMASLATTAPDGRSDRLRSAAKTAGVDPCPLADET